MFTEDSSEVFQKSLYHSMTIYAKIRNWAGWTDEALAAFEELTSKLVDHSVVALPHPRKPYMITTDMYLHIQWELLSFKRKTKST